MTKFYIYTLKLSKKLTGLIFCSGARFNMGMLTLMVTLA